MIKSLHIENYALIDNLDIELHPGFSVITGETGAGKSIILGAIGLLTGTKLRTKDDSSAGQGTGMMSSKEDASQPRKTIVEAIFDVAGYNLQQFFDDNDLDFDGSECVVRREISIQGKSRAFVNDSPVSLSLLKELGDRLLDIHSQHQNLLLNKEDFQLNVLDILAGKMRGERNSRSSSFDGLRNRVQGVQGGESTLEEYKQSFKVYSDAKSALDKAMQRLGNMSKEEDYMRFQLKELQELGLTEGEQEELEEESELLSHAEDIQVALNEALGYIYSDDDDDAVQNVRECGKVIKRLADLVPGANDGLAERLESCYIELKDIAEEIEDRRDNVETNPNRLERINERLSALYALEQKHRVDSVEELIAIQTDLQMRLSEMDSGEEHIEDLRSEMKIARQEVERLAEILTKERKEASEKVEEQISERLVMLGMPNAQFEITISEKSELDSSGKDNVEFLFSANRNRMPVNIARVASGGEIARVMLALKAMLANAMKMPTIIFDEIDTGVSGGIAEKMAKIMRDMGDNGRQVISITHLPQIAAMGGNHYKVYKTDDGEKTITQIARITGEERVAEVANMLSGEVTGKAALDNARELLNFPN